MLFRRILVFVAGAVVTATAHGAFVDGYCYLEGQTNHCLSTAEITGGITPHLDYTNSAGYYRFELVAAPDTHHFRWAHPGFVTQIHPYYVPFGGVTLPPVTLESKLLCNPESWRFYPYTIPDTTIILPYDEGKHDPTSTYRIEWWYVNFHLTAEDGKQYAGIVSFFKPPVVGLPGMVLFSVVDLELGLMYSDAKYPLITDANDQWLDLAFGVPPQDKWWNRQCEGELMPFEYHLSVSWADEGVNWLELDMGCMKPPMAIGGDGFVEFGDVGWSYYYSHPRTDVVGTLHLQGFPALGKHVEGTAWIDHQWADFPTQDVTWEWFSIQLDDLRDILVADVWINDVQENFSGGLNYYDENCAQEVLHGYTITPLRCWYDTEHDTTYSTQWRVEEPTRQIDLIITAVYEHQVMETTGEIIGANFWEGACTVSGTIEGQPVEGTAFAELTHSWEGLPEACCFEGESCRYLPPELCTDQGGNPQGPGTDCDNTDCPQACCLTDDSCEFLLPGDCTALGGEPQGDGTYCEGEQACCLWGGECVMLAPICCYYREGFPQGPGSECEPYNPCNCACCPTSPFGDGSLGDHVVHSGTNLILNSDANYRNLKIKEGGTVYTAGHTLRVCNTLLNEGTIRAPYSGGEGGEGGEGGLGANPEQTSVPAGCGERGTTCTPGQDGSPGTGRGGDGGCGGGGGGGAKNLGRDADGGNGGAGGAGGNGGGNLLLYAFRLDNRGVIHADGQDGFDGADAPAGDSTYHAGYEHCGAEYYGPPDWPLHDVEGGGGGGGSGGDGGNGGIVEVYYAQLVNSSTIRADRGSGGNGGFGGSKGGCDAHIDLAGSKQNGCADGCAHSTWGHGGRGEYRVGYCSEDGEDGVDGSHGEEGHVNLNVVVFDDCNDNGCPDECDIYRGVSQDCQPNQVPDECDIAAGTSDDCNDNGIPDECELEIVGAWHSWKEHGPTGELGIELDTAATGNDTTPSGGGAGVETRRESVTKLTCTFSKPVDPAGFDETDVTVCGCVNGTLNPTSVSLDATNTVLTMNFGSWQIGNGEMGITADRYLIVISADVMDMDGNHLGGDRDVEVIAQFGNVFNFGPSAGVTNVTDLNQISSHLGETVPDQTAVKYDVFYLGISAGVVNTTDYNQVSSNLTTGGPVCPEPPICP